MTAHALTCLAAAGAVALTPMNASSQQLGELAARCFAAAPASVSPCAEGAVATRALLGQVGLLAGLGAEVPGSFAALGRLRGAAPRFATSIRTAGLQARLPDLTGRGVGPSQASFFVPAMHGSVALGLFEGVRLRPTVGGLLALDFIGQTSILFLPKGQGFAGRVGSLSLGLRLGILRETFTLPGISVSVSHRLVGTVRLGNVALGDPAAIEIEPSVTSIRATIGKDLYAVGLMAGVGWDDYGTDARVRVVDPRTGLVEVASRIDAQRSLLFGSVSLSLLVLQLSTEVGWAWGFSRVDGYSYAPFDPTRGSIFGSLAARLTI